MQPATIEIAEGKISSVIYGKHAEAIDHGDAVIMPGVIDVHVHLNEPGRAEWEGFETGTKAAAAGGTTTVVDMPLNSSPVTISATALEEKREASKGKLSVNCGFYGGLIPGNANQIEEMINAGVLGIKCFLTHSGIDEFPNVTEKDLDEAMPIIARYDVPLLAHCELESECVHELNKYPKSYAAYLASRPKKWENDAIELMIKLCRKHDCRVHIVHVSSSEALDLIKAAKEEGLPLTAETCAQYLYFSAEKLEDGKTIFKCAPPIREKDNNEKLKQALRSGVLDFITTDHSPAPASVKEIETGDLQKAWGGIAGIQFLLSASWTAMKDVMTIEEFIPLVTESPARFIKVDDRKGKIAGGFDADLVIWDPEKSAVIKETDILFRHKISPYIGETLYGDIIKTIVTPKLL